jgi:hypothetical protein
MNHAGPSLCPVNDLTAAVDVFEGLDIFQVGGVIFF